MKKNMKWDNKEKFKLVQLEEQSQNGEVKFMEELKRAWDECYSEFRHLVMQCIRDNAGQFKINKTIRNLSLV